MLNYVRGVFIFLGVVGVLGVIFFAYIYESGKDLHRQSRSAAIKFSMELGDQWRVPDVEEQAGNTLLDALYKPDTKRLLSVYSTLGRLMEVTDIELLKWQRGTQGAVFVYSMKGRFEHGKGLIQIAVYAKDGDEFRVSNFKISSDDFKPYQTAPPMGI